MPDTVIAKTNDEKKELRSKFRKLRASVSESDKRLLDDALCKNVILSSEFKKAKTILCYFQY